MRLPNMFFSRGINGVMVIDLERALILKTPRLTSGDGVLREWTVRQWAGGQPVSGGRVDHLQGIS